jgi:hypothetical protein
VALLPLLGHHWRSGCECVAQETSAAFVTMDSRHNQATVSLGMMSYNEGLWETAAAPSPNEIIWYNVQWRAWERGVRSIISWGVLVTLIFCFVPIVTVLTMITALDTFAKGSNGAWAKFILDLPFLGRAPPLLCTHLQQLLSLSSHHTPDLNAIESVSTLSRL